MDNIDFLILNDCISDTFNHFCRDTAHYRIGRYVFRNDCTCCNNGIVSDGHALQNGSVRAYPHVPAQHDRCWISGFPLFGCETVVERGKDYIMPNLASVAYRDTAMILKMTTSVDEHTFAYGDVFTEISIKRWENTKRLRYFMAEQLG